MLGFPLPSTLGQLALPITKVEKLDIDLPKKFWLLVIKHFLQARLPLREDAE
jgi:hypothetical protein